MNKMYFVECKYCKAKNPINLNEIKQKAGGLYAFQCVIQECKEHNVMKVPKQDKEPPLDKEDTDVWQYPKSNPLNLNPYLLLLASDNHDEMLFELIEGVKVLGRKLDKFVDYPIETKDNYLSRNHVEINVSKGEKEWSIIIRNLGENGIFINKGVSDKPDLKDYQESAPLFNTDYITLGYSKLQLLFK